MSLKFVPTLFLLHHVLNFFSATRISLQKKLLLRGSDFWSHLRNTTNYQSRFAQYPAQMARAAPKTVSKQLS